MLDMSDARVRQISPAFESHWSLDLPDGVPGALRPECLRVSYMHSARISRLTCRIADG